MALTDEGGSGIPATMLVGPANYAGSMPYPVYSGNQGGSGFGNDGNGWWIILLFIILFASGGWNNNNGWGGNGQPIGVNDGNGGSVQRGFDQAAIMGGLSGVQSGVQNLSTQLCDGFAGVNATINGGFANAETAATARQMANMNQAFAAQTAMAQGFNALGSQFANCCCENRLASADLKYTIATENCADRAAVSDGIREVIANQTANTQRILDQICADKIDAKNDTIAQLRQELLYARGQASQTAQTAQILAGQTAEVDALYNRLDTCPIGTTPVYGRTPIFSCNNGATGCGCGCGSV